MKRIVFVCATVVLLGSLVGPTTVTAETEPHRLYVDLQPFGDGYHFGIRVTPIGEADFFRVKFTNSGWEPHQFIAIEGPVAQRLIGDRDEIGLGGEIPGGIPGGLLGFTAIEVILIKNDEIVAEDSVIYNVRRVTPEENRYHVSLFTHEGDASFVLLPDTAQGDFVIAIAEENILPATEMPYPFNDTVPPILVIHVSHEIDSGNVWVRPKSNNFADFGYRQRVHYLPDTEETQLQPLDYTVGPRGFSTTYAGPGAYAPIKGSRIRLPLVLKQD